MFPAGFYIPVNGEKCYCVILLGQNISSDATYKLTLLYRKYIFKCFHKTRLTSCSIFNKGESSPWGKFNSTSCPYSCDKVPVRKDSTNNHQHRSQKFQLSSGAVNNFSLFVWLSLYWNVLCLFYFILKYSVPLFWYCLENKGFPTFQNSKLTFVKLDKIYFLLSGNLFSDWQQIFCSTRNSREIKESAVECRDLYQNIWLQTQMRDLHHRT